MKEPTGVAESSPLSAHGRSSPGRAELLALALLLALFAVEVAITWQRWADPLVDSGREMHVPERLATGELLYRDVRYFHGPLGPYVNALLYLAFGAKLGVLAAAAIAASIAGLVALFRIARNSLSPLSSALAAAAVMVATFFLPLGGSMLFPYSYNALYASVLSWWALAFFLDHARHREIACGVFTGLAFAARIDSALPVAAAISMAIVLERREIHRRLTKFVLPAGAIALLGYAPFALVTPLDTLRRQGFLVFLRIPEEWRQMYRLVSGFDDPPRRLLQILLAGVVLATILVPLALGAIYASEALRAVDGANRERLARRASVVVFVLLGTLAVVCAAPIPALRETLARLPPFTSVLPLFAAAWCAIQLVRHARSEENASDWSIPTVVGIAAALSGWRVLLNARDAGPYVSMALPLATLAASIFLLRTVPAALERRSLGAGKIAAGFAFAALGAWCLGRVEADWFYFRDPAAWAPVESPKGRMFVTPPSRAKVIGETLDLVRASAPNSFLFGVPEAGVFQFLGDRPNPVPEEQLHPGTLDDRTEAELVARLSRVKPDTVVVEPDFLIPGKLLRFGVDYHVRLAAFLRENFEVVRVAHEPAPPGVHSLTLVVAKRRAQ